MSSSTQFCTVSSSNNNSTTSTAPHASRQAWCSSCPISFYRPGKLTTVESPSYAHPLTHLTWFNPSRSATPTPAWAALNVAARRSNLISGSTLVCRRACLAPTAPAETRPSQSGRCVAAGIQPCSASATAVDSASLVRLGHPDEDSELHAEDQQGLHIFRITDQPSQDL